MNRSIEKWAKIFDEEGHAEGFIEKMDDGTEYKCELRRYVKNGYISAWNGYVYLERGHILYGNACDFVDVHGGITLSIIAGKVSNMPFNVDGCWALGFDCGHLWDITPGYVLTSGEVIQGDEYATYKNKKYTKDECINLAHQIHDYVLNHNKPLIKDDIMNEKHLTEMDGITIYTFIVKDIDVVRLDNNDIFQKPHSDRDSHTVKITINKAVNNLYIPISDLCKLLGFPQNCDFININNNCINIDKMLELDACEIQKLRNLLTSATTTWIMSKLRYPLVCHSIILLEEK